MNIVKSIMYIIGLFVLSTVDSSANPKVCYDYTISQDGMGIETNDDNSFHVSKVGIIFLNVTVKNQETFLPFRDVKQDISFTPSGRAFAMNQFYILDNKNISNDIGTLEPATSYISANKYLMLGEYSGKFNIKIDTNYRSRNITLSTEDGSLPRCEKTLEYKAKYGQFNVERHNSSGSQSQKYPLYTQVVGKDFDFDVVAYTNPPSYTQELPLQGYTVEVELIDAQNYMISGCENPDQSIIKKLTSSGRKSLFARFGSGRSRVDMSDVDIETDTALRSASFRIWTIVDKKGRVVPHTCSTPADNKCFSKIYNDYLLKDDTSGKCTNCSGYKSKLRGDTGCYACLKDNFSKATCSRDNFSIRPASYRITVGDSVEVPLGSQIAIKTLGINDSADNEPIDKKLAAGYKYMLTVEAMGYARNGGISHGYNVEFKNDSRYRESILYFSDKETFYDKNNTIWNITFKDGYVSPTLVSHSNIGKYRYNIHDSDWTLVDQARYTKKRYSGDDCASSSTYISTNDKYKNGCDIDSKKKVNGAIYNDLYLYYVPYIFNVSSSKMAANPKGKYLFMSNLDDDYYNTIESLSNPMAVVYEGNVTAMSKDGKITTNFTSNAAAFDLSYTMIYGSSIKESDLENKMNAPFQNYLSYGSQVDIKTKFDFKRVGAGKLTISKEAFEDDKDQGSGRIRVYTTIKKPSKEQSTYLYSEGMPPVNVLFVGGRIDRDNIYYPSISIPLPATQVKHDLKINFLYSKVSPEKKRYIVKGQKSVITPLNILVYCPYDVSICRRPFNLVKINKISHESSNWYYAENLLATPDNMGDTDISLSSSRSNILLNAAGSALGPRKKIDDIHYSTQGTNVDIMAVLRGSPPAKSKIVYTSSPWLEYDVPNQYYQVEFLGNPDPIWSGVGQTGHVVDGEINSIQHKRVEW